MDASEVPLDITHAIQLAIAPVFLLTGISGILNVLSGRLGRVVDRMRVLLERLESAKPEKAARMQLEIDILTYRRVLVNRAIFYGTAAALLVCLIIAIAFVGTLVQVRTGWVIGGLFTLAITCIVLSLIYFLREVIASGDSQPSRFH